MGPVLVAAPPASAASFSNATPIVTPLPGVPPGCPNLDKPENSCPSAKAAPYPSAISVGGQSGTVTDVNVTLRDLTYDQNGPADADVMLVAPGGKSVMLMSDACGDGDNHYPITSPITLTFDDQAGAALPADAACASGMFKPVDDDNDVEFPFGSNDGFPGAPAPAGTQLSSLNGIAPNGAWNLYVVDDYPNDPNPNGKAGQIGGGWSIDISTSAAAAPVTTVATAPPTTTRPATTVAAPVTTGAPAATPPPGSEVIPPPVTSTVPLEPAQPGDFVPLAADTEEGSDNTVLVAVVILLVAGALGIMAMFRPGGWRFWRR